MLKRQQGITTKDQNKTARTIISALSEENQVQVREMEGRGRYCTEQKKRKCKLYSLEC